MHAAGDGTVADLELGRRRARAGTMLILALPGGTYLYQGEELGLEEVEDIPDELLQDPTFARSAARRAAATAAGSRCRGRAMRRRSASARTGRSPGCRNPRTGGT
jgi:glycosidase